MNARAIVLCVALAAFSLGCPRPPAIPENSPVDRAVWLDQNWSDAERHWAHHASQGTATLRIPYAWLMALEQPVFSFGAAPLLSDPDYLRRFGFIPSPAAPKGAAAYGYTQRDASPYVPKIARYNEDYGENPDRLPVGFARMKDGETDYVGFTCAACHTGHLEYEGVSIRIDGAPAVTNLSSFRDALGIALGYTDSWLFPGRFDRFADRVLGEDASDEKRDALRQAVANAVETGKAQKAFREAQGDGDDREGFARLDALTRIGNEVFYLDLLPKPKDLDAPENDDAKSNYRRIVAPVNFPHIWATSWFDWVQYDGSIHQPMTRNAGEALGVAARVNLTDPEKGLYESTVAVKEIYELEQLLAGEEPHAQNPPRFTGLRAPKWPEDLLEPLDDDGPDSKAAKGAKLYAELCARCHMAPVESAEFWNGSHWSKPGKYRQRLLRVPNFSLKTVGTDPAQAEILATRSVKVPAHLEIPPPPQGDLCSDAASPGAVTEVSFAWALGVVVEKTVGRWYDQHDVDPATREEMDGLRRNCLRADTAYKARPLDGIWATPPYLHNGSVPNLYELLSPANERSETFYLGSRLFDPVKVGYQTKQVDGAFEVDTKQPGNRNTGHLYTDDEAAEGRLDRKLEQHERWELVEYLKTL